MEKVRRHKGVALPEAYVPEANKAGQYPRLGLGGGSLLVKQEGRGDDWCAGTNLLRPHGIGRTMGTM